MQNPCLRCGACCASFMVAFDKQETDLNGLLPVPLDLTVEIKGLRRAMKGTDRSQPRCIALEGRVGSKVTCSIYQNRSSTCKKFFFSGENGISNASCDRARGFYGLLPLVSDVF